MRLLVAVLFACFGLAGASGCADDDFGQERPPSDMGAEQFDLASSDLAGIDLAGIDLAGSDLAGVDAAVVADLSIVGDFAHWDGEPTYGCSLASDCNTACGQNQPCAQSCVYRINTANGVTLFMSLQKCYGLAMSGQCAAMCSTVSVDCAGCLFAACQSEYAACTQDL